MKINKISAQQLAAQKGERQLFENIGFELSSGQCLLLQGPNGSGKTTLLHMLAGAEKIETGKLEIIMAASPEPRIDGVFGISHFISHQNSLKANLTVYENLKFWTEFLGGEISKLDQALSTVGLAPMPHILAARLSAGQKKRLMLAKLLTISHPLWLLDEPSVSLDAEGQKLLTILMQNHLKAGGILIASSHIPLGVEFDQILSLDGGKYLFNDDYLLEEQNL